MEKKFNFLLSHREIIPFPGVLSEKEKKTAKTSPITESSQGKLRYGNVSDSAKVEQPRRGPRVTKSTFMNFLVLDRPDLTSPGCCHSSKSQVQEMKVVVIFIKLLLKVAIYGHENL